MFTLKHLKTLQHVSIIIRIIFRELVGSLLKSLNLKFFKSVRGQLWWWGSITFGVCATAHTPNVMLPHHHNWSLTLLRNF